tara:strand:- start:7 stop:138 length:132 start_codon:yes stop_codon:yes gene_type:complete
MQVGQSQSAFDRDYKGFSGCAGLIVDLFWDLCELSTIPVTEVR